MPGQEWLRSRLHPSAGRADDRLESRLVWMMGSPRTGTTWLLNLMCLHARVRGLDEPLIGAHLGLPVAALVGATQGSGSVASQFRVVDRFAGDRCSGRRGARLLAFDRRSGVRNPRPAADGSG